MTTEDRTETDLAERAVDFITADLMAGGDIGSDPVPFLYAFPAPVRFLALLMLERCPVHECDHEICADDGRTTCAAYR